MNNVNTSKDAIFSCDATNLPNNFQELAIESYNKHGVFYITGIYTSSEVEVLRNDLDLLYKESGSHRGRGIKDIKDIDLKNKFYKVIMNPSVMDLLNGIFSNSDISLLPPYEVVKNHLPHSIETEVSGWHRDCGGQEGIKECRSNLSNQEYVFGKIGLYLQDNSEYGGAIDIVPGSNRDYFRFLKTWQVSKFSIVLLMLLQRFFPLVHKIIANTKLINYLMGATTTKVRAGDIVIFDYRVWHKGTPARADIEKGLVYHYDSIQADLPVEKTKYVFYSQFGNTLGIKSYFIDRLNREGNATEIDSWIDEAISLDKSEVDIHEFLKKRHSLFDGSFKDLFGLS